MTQYRDLHYEDSDDLNQFTNPANTTTNAEQEALDQQYEENLLKQLEEGKISETQYNTLTKTNNKHESEVDENGFLIELEKLNIPDPTEEETKTEEPQEQTPQYHFDPNYWTDQLEDDDINYLMLK